MAIIRNRTYFKQLEWYFLIGYLTFLVFLILSTISTLNETYDGHEGDIIARAILYFLLGSTFFGFFYFFTRKFFKDSLAEYQHKIDLQEEIAKVFISYSNDELYSKALSIILAEMNCSLGLLGYINSNGDLVSPSLTRDVWDRCQVPGKDIIFKKETWTGVWGDTLNNKKSYIVNEGLNVPLGHVPLQNCISVPILFKEELIGIIIVANKKSKMNNTDLKTLKYFANYISPILKEKLLNERHEEEKESAEKELEHSRMLYSRLLLHSENIVYEMEIESGYIKWYGEIEKITGYSVDYFKSLNRNTFKTLILDEDKPKYEKFISNKTQPNKTTKFEYRIKDINDEIIFVEEQRVLTAIPDKQSLIIGSISDITERKKLVNRIKEQNEFLLDVINSLPFPFYVIDTKTREIKLANETAYSGNLPPGMLCHKLTHNSGEPCNNNEHPCPLEIINKNKKPVILEHIHVNNEGEQVNVEVHGYPLFDEYGNVSQMIEFSIDITERKQFERAIKESEKKLSLLFDTSPQPLVLFDIDTLQIKMANRAAIEMFELDESKINKYHSKDFYLNQEDREKASAKLAKLGYLENYELELKSINDKKYWTLMNINTFKFEDEMTFLVALTDITSRKEIEKELLERDEKLNKIIQNSSDLICETNSLGRYTFVNVHYKDLRNISDENELIGRDAFEHIHPEDIQALSDKFHSAMEKLEPTRADYRYKTANNDWIWLQSLANFYERNNSKYSIIISRDVTKTKEIEENLKKAKEDAEATNRAKSEFLANMSHEIRTPMNSIIGFSEMLIEKATDLEQKNHLKSILSSGKVLLNLINDILILSRIEAGKLEINPSPVNLPEILKEMESIYQPKAVNKQLTFKLIFDSKIPQAIEIDELRLRQILNNILDNAVKFTKKGFIEFKIDYEIIDDKVNLAFIIVDSGIGIKKEVVKDIFSYFNTGNNTTHRNYSGTGLGLAISKKLTELMGGSIDCKSVEGEGTTISIHLNNIGVISSLSIPITHESLTKDISWENTSVLIADDLDTNRQLLKLYLKKNQIKVYSAENGYQAVELAKKEKPSIILMDLRMPELDGIEATKIIKSDNLTKNIPVIGISAALTKGTENETKSANFDDLLEKPVNKKKLFDVLLKFIPSHILSYEHADNNDNEDFFNRNKYDNTGIESEKWESIISRFTEGDIANMYDKIKKSSIVSDISYFADIIKETGEQHNINILKMYGSELHEYISIFDFENISKMLDYFPEMLNRVNN